MEARQSTTSLGAAPFCCSSVALKPLKIVSSFFVVVLCTLRRNVGIVLSEGTIRRNTDPASLYLRRLLETKLAVAALLLKSLLT